MDVKSPRRISSGKEEDVGMESFSEEKKDGWF